MAKEWNRRRVEKVKNGDIHEEGTKWRVWDDFYQGVVIGKKGARLMKHMNRIVTQQFKTTAWWYKAYPEKFGNTSKNGCMECPCCGTEVETLRHMFERCGHDRLQMVRLKMEKNGQKHGRRSYGLLGSRSGHI